MKSLSNDISKYKEAIVFEYRRSLFYFIQCRQNTPPVYTVGTVAQMICRATANPRPHE
ncbi:MAG: hypothetical protein QNJ37_07525 [Crocosphaera sp.]|nr:hypothetical protein [Crocosphaera sp.]MDJ0730596.1 hypothetical protein [Crocosphaera sp.]